MIRPAFMLRNVLLFSLILSAFHILPICAQSVRDSVAYKIYPFRIEQDFDISSKLNKAVWKQARPVFISHEFTPDDQNK
jgi:hypothetical protein